MDDDKALLVTVNDDTDDEDDNVEVPETKFGYEEWINHEADDDDKMDGDDIVNVDAENLVTVDELADQIRKKVQMKTATTDCYKNEITELQRKNVVTFRKLKRNKAEHSNLFLKKRLYEWLVAMEEKGIVQQKRLEESQRLQGHRYWRQYLSSER